MTFQKAAILTVTTVTTLILFIYLIQYFPF
jgi:hypothetical protein